MTNNVNNEVCNKKIRNKVFLRWFLNGETGWNYEKMQGSGYCYSIMPALKEIYKDDPDALQQAVKNHLQFFNTTPHTANIIFGVNMAVEQAVKQDGKDAIASIKTGLMGPLAGVGDSLFGVIIDTIFGSIAAYMALEGNPLGCIIWILVSAIAITMARYFMMEIGYKQGTEVVNNISGKLKKITDAANILGLTVVGALIPTVINAKTAYVFEWGKVKMPVQDMIDSIMPALLPVCVVAFVYWLLNRKGMNSTKVILAMIVLSIAFSFFGILG
ncbi:MAG: PTS system mannose/fructose/sorbose family transporter subunit IID [Erysipelotrichaceae bacterium]